MNIWNIKGWKKNHPNDCCRTGIRFRYDSSVDPEVKRAFGHFAAWIRGKYQFPLRVNVYIKGTKTIIAKDGEHVVGTFFEPFLSSDEPHIRIATGDYNELENEVGKDNALASILLSLAHELTHYYQWINNAQLTSTGRERQADRCAGCVIDEYALTRDPSVCSIRKRYRYNLEDCEKYNGDF